MTKNIIDVHTYSGNAVFAPFCAGLYGVDDDSESHLLYEDTKENIKHEFSKRYGAEIENALAQAGMAVVEYQFYSPRFYNYETDSLDVVIRMEDESKYLAWCEAHKDAIQKRLDENVARPGYMPLTAGSYDEAVKERDITIVIEALSKIEFSEDDLYEWLVWDYPCDECGEIHSLKDEYESDNRERYEKIVACEKKTITV